ncbi:MAG: phenylacetate--CoA ligase family protein, partial [Proteobacteria bacterium]|nr:phenylacetate--CoA ligase family protein [Pseudomonadota bacterium]
MDDAEAASPGELVRLRQELWGAQADYVAASSPFFQALWAGRRPPARLEDLPELPLADKSMLRASQAAHPPFGDYLAAPPDSVIRLHRT